MEKEILLQILANQVLIYKRRYLLSGDYRENTGADWAT